MSSPAVAASRRPAVPPYFDGLLARLAENDPVTAVAFGRHVHWGYWADPKTFDGTPTDFAWAAEQLCRRICDAAPIGDERRLLDVGCGFGGTLASLNERRHGLDMVGVNIDPRQLERAEQVFQPWHGNRARFIEADAGALSLPDGSFDVVLAVECIFHFPSRAAFFAEASRVLRPGGTLTLSDFVPPEAKVPLLKMFNPAADDAIRRTYGEIDVLCSLESYRELADQNGMRLAHHEDITRHTLPTYTFLRRCITRDWQDELNAKLFDRATAQLETASKSGLLAYTILTFEKWS